MTGFLKGHRERMQLQKDHIKELEQFKNDHKEVVRLLLADHKAEIESIERGNEGEFSRYKRWVDDLQDKLESTEQKLKAQLSEKDRMEKLLTKVTKRAGIYRAMMEATAAWEEEIAIEREEDKVEQFIKWKGKLRTNEILT